jgi:hypothetical protein
MMKKKKMKIPPTVPPFPVKASMMTIKTRVWTSWMIFHLI